MAQPILRQLKLRSEEQQILNRNYNKSTVIIPADALYTTDLSQSYLNLKLKIKTYKEKELTTADLIHLKSKDLAVSFGHGSLDYSPACLIKSAVLKRGDGSIIESIPFSNIISQSMFQFTNNKESVSNKSLLTGMCFESNALTGSMSSIVKNPIQIQIPLSDLFQSCQSNNWWMSESKGLIFDLEFEDKKHLMKLNKITNRVLKNTNPVDPTLNLLNLKPTLEFNDLLAFDDPEKFYFTEINGNNITTKLQQPKCLLIPASQYFIQPNLALLPNPEELPLNRTLVFNENNSNITIEAINSLGININDYIKMNFRYEIEGISKTFHYYNKVVEFIPEVPAVPEIPPVYVGIVNSNTAEWFPTAPHVNYYLSGPGAPLNTDIVRLEININPETGVYSLEAGYEMNLTRAYTAGQKYIIPAYHVAHYMITVPHVGTPQPQDCVLTVTASVAIGTVPVFTVEGAAQPLPSATPPVPKVNAKLILENSLFSDVPQKYSLYNIELLNGNLFTTLDKTEHDFENLIRQNKIIVSETEITYLKEKGLVTDDYKITDTCFDLIVQNEYTENSNVNVSILTNEVSTLSPEIIEDNKIYSNGAFILPNTGRKVKLNKLVQLTEFYELHFSNLGLADNYGFQFKGVNRPSNSHKWEKSMLNIPKVKIGFVNFVKMQEALVDDTALIEKISEGLTYDIDLLEVVVQQQTKNKKLPMPKVYSTFSIEPFTIEHNLYSLERQFNVMNPNCYNIAILMPHNDTLISSCMERNVFSYRFQINNISNTQTDLHLKTLISDYPSSLHLDKQIDYFTNSSYLMKTLFGIKGLENAAVVPSLLPLKIYTANDPSSYYTNPAGFSVQILMNSAQEAGPILQGTCYLLKSVLKSM